MQATCVDIAPAGASALYECRECLDTCADGACVDFKCVDCASSKNCDAASAPECTSENECGGCTTNAACEHRRETPYCDVESGECVECTKDDDCAGTPGAPACSPAFHCVECTEGSHCPDNPGGCLLFPGEDEYTCASLDTNPDALGECARCNAYECAPELVCAGPDGEERCLPLAEPDDPCGPSELYSEEFAGSVIVCMPELCAP
jgi:hypothetical protein